jgi:hypothetical protein
VTVEQRLPTRRHHWSNHLVLDCSSGMSIRTQEFILIHILVICRNRHLSFITQHW